MKTPIPPTQFQPGRIRHLENTIERQDKQISDLREKNDRLERLAVEYVSCTDYFRVVNGK